MFDQLEKILAACGGSYYDGTACHLDIVQWATDPSWGKLPKTVRQRLVTEDHGFLLNQFQDSATIQTALLNGRSVIEHFSESLRVELREEDPLAGYAKHNTRLFVGKLLGRVLVIGWSTNLQSSFGVSNELRRALASKVADLIAADTGLS
jgi:hypothetical protein